MKSVYIINFATASIVFTIGFLMVFKIILPFIEPSTRIIFGIIFMAYGVYRYVTTQTKIKVRKFEELKKKMDKEQYELIHKK